MPIPVLVAAARIAAQKAAQKAARAKALQGALGSSEADGDTPELLGVEGIAMLFTALMFDFIPPIFIWILNLNPFLPGAGEFISPGVSFFATITLGAWMFFRGGRQGMSGKLMQFIKKRGPLIGLEYVPILQDAPLWTVNVFMFLKK